MKTKRFSNLTAAMTAIAFAFVAAPLASAQSDTITIKAGGADKVAETRASQPMGQQAGPVFGTRAENVIGMQVLAANAADDQEIGEVQDLLIDTQSGKIVYAVVQSGGLLGIGAEHRAVPFSSLNLAQGDSTRGYSAERVGVGNYFTLALSADKWNDAPEMDDDFFETEYELRDQSFRYYGASTDYLDGSSGEGRLARATDLMDIEIANGDDDVGEIEDVIINVQRRTASLLVEPEGGPDLTGSDVVIGFNKVNFARGEDLEPATTSLTNADFQNARRWERDMASAELDGSPYLWDSAAIGAVGPYGYGAYGMYGYTPVADNDRVVVNERNELDVDDLRDALENDPRFEEALDDVEIEQEGRQLVLSGEVNSEQLKREIADAVQQRASGWAVDNRLEVRTAAE